MIFLARYWSQLVTGLCVGTLVWGMTHSVWEARYQAQRAKAERTIAEFARAEAEAQERARKAEQARAEAVAAAADQYERGKEDAQAKADRVVADLRAGNVRLRQHWQASVATCELSHDSTAARHAEELAQLRAEAAGRIVRIGAEADAQVRALQEAYEALMRAAP